MLNDNNVCFFPHGVLNIPTQLCLPLPLFLLIIYTSFINIFIIFFTYYQQHDKGMNRHWPFYLLLASSLHKPLTIRRRSVHARRTMMIAVGPWMSCAILLRSTKQIGSIVSRCSVPYVVTSICNIIWMKVERFNTIVVSHMGIELVAPTTRHGT